jgi:hypothetical protein
MYIFCRERGGGGADRARSDQGRVSPTRHRLYRHFYLVNGFISSLQRRYVVHEP